MGMEGTFAQKVLQEMIDIRLGRCKEWRSDPCSSQIKMDEVTLTPNDRDERMREALQAGE